MPEKCYLCDKPFDSDGVLKHGEHIIQDSLGGTLIADEILCASCGSKLGNSVDGPFVAALAPLTVLLDLPRGAGAHAKAKVRLALNEDEASSLSAVTFLLSQDFTIAPSRPLMLTSEAKKTVTVIGSTLKQAEQFSNSPAVKAALSSGYALELSENAATYAQSLLVPVSPSSVEVLRGVLKIAIEFANHSGVPRAVFKHLLADGDMTNSEALLRSSIFPYYPTTDAERFFETEKHTHEDWFPTHHLYIFSQYRSLYCYVELFGTIQNYVLLSAEYDGPPVEAKFIQKAERWEFNADTFTAKDE
ncbi:HNH endonuclease [Malikia granosa]|uniref:HNH endonuclease n=1 Tax=Malikia granosa TaxID=263067 RepID=UPI0014742F4C|nr:HNH endonuclease [Malikia granosa]